MIEAHAAELDVLVRRVVSPLDTGSIHGRGQGLLRGDPGVEVTFLIDHADFVSLRERLVREGEVRFGVSLAAVTAIDAGRRPAPAGSGWA